MRKEKDEEDAAKGGKTVKTKQEAREKAEKREREVEEEKGKKASREQEGNVPKGQGMVDVHSTGGVSSISSQAPPSSAQPGIATGAGKRTFAEPWNEDGAPDKAQKIFSICVGRGAFDKKGKGQCREL